MKHIIVALFAGSLALSSMSVLSADAAKDELQKGPAQGETKTEKAKDYAKKKAHNTKVHAKKATKKVKDTAAKGKPTDPASPSETKVESPPKPK